MSSGVTVSEETARRVPARSAFAPMPLSSGRHAHHCLACGAKYECRGPEEIGYCAPVCPPCYWIELGSQLRIYKQVVSELERKRSGIERRIGKDICKTAAARRRKLKTDASLLVAFGNLLSTQSTLSGEPCSEGQGGGSHD
jgi:hypothetical protein